MNNTIDFKTAKTIDSMSKKLDHIDDAVTGFFSIMHMAMKNELGSAEPYFRRNLAGSGSDGYPS